MWWRSSILYTRRFFQPEIGVLFFGYKNDLQMDSLLLNWFPILWLQHLGSPSSNYFPPFLLCMYDSRYSFIIFLMIDMTTSYRKKYLYPWRWWNHFFFTSRVASMVLEQRWIALQKIRFGSANRDFSLVKCAKEKLVKLETRSVQCWQCFDFIIAYWILYIFVYVVRGPVLFHEWFNSYTSGEVFYIIFHFPRN